MYTTNQFNRYNISNLHRSFANCNTVRHPIKIYINAQDVYTLSSNSYINIREQLRRNDNDNPYAAADEVALINNAMMYLFAEVKYDLYSTNIEKLSSPGQITSLFGYLSQPDDFSTSADLKYCWNKNTTPHASSAEFAESALAPAAHYTPTRTPEYNAEFAARKGLLASSNPIGHFSFNIPLSHIFGFAEYKSHIRSETYSHIN